MTLIDTLSNNDNLVRKLGTVPDIELAKRYEVSKRTIIRLRKKLDIESWRSSRIGEYICPICDKKFTRWKSQKERDDRNGLLFCSRRCASKWQTINGTTKVRCDDCGKFFLKQNSVLRRTKHNFCSRKCLYNHFVGVNHHNYNDGGTYKELRRRISSLSKYDTWRKDILERDNHICVICGKSKSHKLIVHHIKPINQIIQDYNIKNSKDAIKCKELWDSKNGITLCNNCHYRIHGDAYYE